jgi:hypothetical protein
MTDLSETSQKMEGEIWGVIWRVKEDGFDGFGGG